MKNFIKYLLVSIFAATAIVVVKANNVSAACAALPTTYGSATATVSIPSSGTYTVWSRISAPDTTNNSYYLEVGDSNCGIVVGDSAIAANTWTWVDYKSGSSGNKITMNLSAGNHTVKMIGKEPSVKLDRILFLSDTCVPTGTGDNCLTTSEPPASVSVNITGVSEGQTVSGTLSPGPGADVTGTTSINSVAFYIDNQHYRTEVSKPYCMVGDQAGPCFDYDTTGLSNGQHSIKAVVTYDNSTKTAEKTVNFTVNNEVEPPPPPPAEATLSISGVSEGQTVSGNITVGATPQDASGITKIEFYLDGTLVQSDANSPYCFAGNSSGQPCRSYDTTQISNGSHTILARMYYGSSQTLDATVNFSVNNEVTPPPPPADTTAPSIPQNVQASDITDTSITLTWQQSTDDVAVAKYYIYRSANKVGEVNHPTTSFKNSGLQPNTPYLFCVSAIDSSNNESICSSFITVSTTASPDTQKPSAPTNLSATAVSGTQINLSWNASTDNVSVAKYVVFRDGLVIAETTSTSYQNKNLLPSTTYSYYVKAVDTSNNVGDASSTVSATTQSVQDTEGPTAPTNLTAQAISFAQVNLSWNGSNDGVGVAGYKIYRNGGPTPIAITSASTTTYADGTVAAETLYRYTVKAFDSAGNESASSNIATITTPKAHKKVGDLNNDGKVDITDLAILLSNWKRKGFTESDLNGDGVVDIYDLALQLTSWDK